MKKLLSLMIMIVSTHQAYAQGYSKECDFGRYKLTFSYPNPGGSSNWMRAETLVIESITDEGVEKLKEPLRATQAYLKRFHGPNSYGNSISAIFVNDNAELVLELDAADQRISIFVPYEGTINLDGVCLLETGE